MRIIGIKMWKWVYVELKCATVSPDDQWVKSVIGIDAFEDV